MDVDRFRAWVICLWASHYCGPIQKSESFFYRSTEVNVDTGLNPQTELEQSFV